MGHRSRTMLLFDSCRNEACRSLATAAECITRPLSPWTALFLVPAASTGPFNVSLRPPTWYISPIPISSTLLILLRRPADANIMCYWCCDFYTKCSHSPLYLQGSSPPLLTYKTSPLSSIANTCSIIIQIYAPVLR